MISHICACTHKNTYITFIRDNNLHLKFNVKVVILHINCINFFMDVCYSNTYGTLKFVHMYKSFFFPWIYDVGKILDPFIIYCY